MDTRTFSGHNNVQSGNEVGSGNRFVFVFNGAASIIAVLLVAVLMLVVIVFMAHEHGSLLAFLVAASFILMLVIATCGVVTCIACKTFLMVSYTRSQHTMNQNNQQWSRHVYQLPSGQVASMNPATRELTVHSARDIQEIHHHTNQFPPGGQYVPSSQEKLPALWELGLQLPKDSNE